MRIEYKLDIKPQELAWLAGLLEGEGCFTNNGPGGSACVKLNMVDEDVVRRSASLINTGVWVEAPKTGYRKAPWHWKVSGQRARILMEAILPYMGERRAKRIIEHLCHPNWGFPDSYAGSHWINRRRNDKGQFAPHISKGDEL